MPAMAPTRSRKHTLDIMHHCDASARQHTHPGGAEQQTTNNTTFKQKQLIKEISFHNNIMCRHHNNTIDVIWIM